MAILESFLRARGNLRDMERELGLSYPTVRGRVDALVRALGLTTEAAAERDGAAEASAHDGSPAGARRAVLERLARKEITPEDAAEALRGMTANSSKGSAPRREGGE